MEKESALENQLIQKLQNQGYEFLTINNLVDLKLNLKNQIEKLNNYKFKNDLDFEQFFNKLNTGTIFERSIRLRNDKIIITDSNNIKKPLKLLDTINFLNNNFQVIHQYRAVEESNKRYDVTILINGLPLVQIELKKRGIEISEAFNQIRKYSEISYSGLFRFIQLFIISSGTETKYFATADEDNHLNFNQTFTWTDVNNIKINELIETVESNHKSFSETFMMKENIFKMLTDYMVFQKQRIPHEIKVLRPYQIYAIEAIREQLTNTNRNGYIWHTTGSGKTLTSFKAADLINSQDKNIDGVIFVVDRIDLDSQTSEEFSDFANYPDDILNTKNTNELLRQLETIFHKQKKVIITTIQKLNNAVEKMSSKEENINIKNLNLLFIFDECHRSHFGKQHKLIRNYFVNSRMIGFTGTPIFTENARELGETTEKYFDDCLHKYTIKEAIKEGNVLPFSIQYLNTWKIIEQNKLNAKNNLSDGEDVEGTLNKKEIWEHSERLANNVKFILETFDQKTRNRKFNALFVCGTNIAILNKYYDEFMIQNEKLSKEKQITIGAIFSTSFDEKISDSGETCDTEESLIKIINNSSKFLKIKPTSKTKFNKKIEKTYRDGLIKNMKDIDSTKRVNLVLVVNMLTTGFDSKFLNTIYIDKNLKHHNLIQTFSRTNRIMDETKQVGNIVSFRPLKGKTDEAIRLFSSGNSGSILFDQKSYDEYVKEFNELMFNLQKEFGFVEDVLNLESEAEKKAFVLEFRKSFSLLNLLKTFIEFDRKDLEINETAFNEYERVYRKIYQENQDENEKISGLELIDFKIEELITSKVDIHYIEEMLAKTVTVIDDNEFKRITNEILDNLEKRSNYPQKLITLVENFFNELMNEMETNGQILEKWKKRDELTKLLHNFFMEERQKELLKLVFDYELDEEKFNNIIEKYNQINDFDLSDFYGMHKKYNYTEEWTINKEIISKIQAIYNNTTL